MEPLKHKNPKHLSDDALDAIAALTLIVVIVMAVVFWLSDLPY
jgi:hypothetical protein